MVILESMKMEMPVEVEDDGMVKEIRCEEGQSVQEGDVLSSSSSSALDGVAATASVTDSLPASCSSTAPPRRSPG